MSEVRSNNLNRYYWGTLVHFVIKGLHDAGYQLNEIDSASVHKFLKKRFCPPTEIFNVQKNGLDILVSTSVLSNKLFKEYFLYIQIWATTYLGIYIPDPNETL